VWQLCPSFGCVCAFALCVTLVLVCGYYGGSRAVRGFYPMEGVSLVPSPSSSLSWGVLGYWEACFAR
jgi:hypothetical protein